MILNSLILSDKSREIDEMDEEFQLMYLASIIVDSAFNFFKIERITSDKGKPPFELKDMIKLIFYGYINKITSSVVLAHNFEHIAIDGTIKKAYNSPFNIIKEKDISLLIRHYMVEELSKNEIKQLRRTARKFLMDKSLSDEEKVDILFHWWQLLDYSGQVSLALNNHDTRLMKIKDKGQKYPKFAYNIQLGTDTKSKLIYGVNAVQNPTDHYQIPALMNQILVNLQLKPQKISADTIYSTLANLQYLEELDITALIPTKQQNRQNSGNQPDNPFAIDYFVFDEYKNVFICPEKQELILDGVYPAPQEKGGGNKIKLVYSNYTACKKCKHKGTCYTTNHRTITRYVHEVTYKVERLMST